MTALDIYLLTRLDGIISFFDVVIFVTIVSFIALGCFVGATIDDWCNDEDEPKKIIFKWFKINIFIGLISLIAIVFVPSTKEAAAMYVVPKLYNSLSENKKIAEIPDNLINLANSWIKDLTKEKKDK